MKRKDYEPTNDPPMWAKGSKYGPLQSDGTDYLCPDCGGYGYIYDESNQCVFCLGKGIISLADDRVTNQKPIT